VKACGSAAAGGLRSARRRLPPPPRRTAEKMATSRRGGKRDARCAASSRCLAHSGRRSAAGIVATETDAASEPPAEAVPTPDPAASWSEPSCA